MSFQMVLANLLAYISIEQPNSSKYQVNYYLGVFGYHPNIFLYLFVSTSARKNYLYLPNQWVCSVRCTF